MSCSSHTTRRSRFVSTFSICAIKSHKAYTAKMIKSLMFLGIMQVDAKATRHSNRFDVLHMEVAGPSNNAFNNHIID
ncbi:unnamed protein product [Rhizophagus irregularis]|nr:unnamed protein product [Rhizophagus irregularis]